MANLSGTTLGKYQVGKRLGRGGMAEVYKAYHPQLERYAAVKVLHGFLAEGQDFLARFQREAKAIAALHHPNIVQIYDIDIEDEIYFMVMEFIDGGTLKDRLLQSKNPLPIAEIAHIFRETASALDYAHHQGMLHRDIKPANILLGKKGRVVLTDFGIARILSDTQFTATGTLVGTPAYMSPEQGKGLPVSASSDIYSLGIVLYEMLTGKVPFDADTPLGVIYQHINAPMPSPRTIRSDIPRVLEEVILKATEKEPTDRFQTASEMIKAVDMALDEFKQVTLSETIVETPKRKSYPENKLSEAEISFTSKATVAMDMEEDFVNKSTVAIEEAIAEKLPTPKRPDPKPDAAKKSPSEPKAISAPVKKKFNLIPVILGIIGIILAVGLLIWGAPKLSGGADCGSADECNRLAEELRESNNPEEALPAIEKAIDFVPENEHSANAHLWCFKGDLLSSIDQRDEAVFSFENCINWSEGSPETEDLRIFAQEQIDRLNNP